MTGIHTSALPAGALLCHYAQQGAYTDCYVMDVPGLVTQAAYVETFYTTPLFKVERRILALLAAKPSNDLQARQLAQGQATHFSAWRVEQQTGHQLLLCDFLGRTRSWLMSVAREEGGGVATRLYFGSAVVPTGQGASGRPSFGLAFHALKGFHQLYTRALMQAALTRLRQHQPGPAQNP
jgi:hypothetical protein